MNHSKSAGIQCNTPTLKYGPQPSERASTALGRISVNAAKFVVSNDLGGKTVTYTSLPEDKKNIDELVAAQFCKATPEAELRSKEAEEKIKRNSYSYGLRCEDNYSDLRKFLLSTARPEYNLATAHSEARSDALATSLSKFSSPVTDAIGTLPIDALEFVMDGDPSATTYLYEGSGPNLKERESINAVVSAGLCQKESPDELRALESKNGKSRNAYAFGVSCQQPFFDVRDLVTDGLILNYFWRGRKQ